MNEKQHRTLILSLDGATWDVLDPMVSAGYLPTIKDLQERGASGSLESVCPPITAAAWTSFQTGLDPAHHGVFTFSNIMDSGRRATTVDAKSTNRPKLWDYLNAEGLDTLSVNLPGTYPTDALPGTTVAGLMAPTIEDPQAVSDEQVRSLIQEVYPDYEVFRNPRNRYDPHEDPQSFVSALTENVHAREAVGEALLTNEAWDVAMVHVQATDVLQHPLWKHLDPGHPAHDPNRYEDVVDFYQAVDDTLSTLLTTARDQASHLDIYLISDHGFQPLHRKVYTDAILEKSGFLIRSGKGSDLKTTLLKLAKRLDVFDLRKAILSKERRVSLGQELNAGLVDWDRSEAWAHGNLYGYVYLDGAEKEAVIDAIEQFNRDHGGDIVASVIDVAERWKDLADDVPELVVVPGPHVSMGTLNGPLSGSVVEEVDYNRDFHVGGHASEGIVIVAGDAAASGTQLKDAQLVDIMPTILARHNIGVPSNLDGNVLNEAFASPVETITVDPLDGPEQMPSEEHREAVESRLRNLGYHE
jgi:predicted AlkP superfamily phosphohydrolase/phosphomutase